MSLSDTPVKRPAQQRADAGSPLNTRFSCQPGQMAIGLTRCVPAHRALTKSSCAGKFSLSCPIGHRVDIWNEKWTPSLRSHTCAATKLLSTTKIVVVEYMSHSTKFVERWRAIRTVAFFDTSQQSTNGVGRQAWSNASAPRRTDPAGSRHHGD